MMADTLFDESGAARDEAIARAEAHATEAWLAAAERIILAISAGGEFTTDQVWDGLAAAGVTTHEPRALGAVMRRMAKHGHIGPTGTYRQSARGARRVGQLAREPRRRRVPAPPHPRRGDPMDAPAPDHAIVTAEFEHPKDGHRAVSFGVRSDTICAQVAGLAEFVPPTATWTAKPGDDVTGHAR